MANQVRGSIHVHEKGFGFVQAEEGAAFVPPPLLNRFLHDDLVEADVERTGDRSTAIDVRLIRRLRTTLFGRLVVIKGGKRFLHVDRAVCNTDWPIDGADAIDDGAWVSAAIDGVRARFTAVVPASEVSMAGLLGRYRIAGEPPAEVTAAAAAAPDVATVIAAELPRRRDLRELVLVTIDGESTRDIDDAVGCFEADDDGALRVVVAIADVAALVVEGSVLDDDARRRGTSVYLPDLVIPMLPRSLSEDRLSLLEGADRLCLACEMRVDVDGVVTAVDVFEGVMRSHARLTYDATRLYLDDADEAAVVDDVKPTLRRLRAAAARLGVQRAARGGMAIERGEARLHFDAEGRPAGVIDVVSTSAHLLIERLMVAANEAVAGWCVDRGLPTLFRVHDAPDLERSTALRDAAAALGIDAGFSVKRPLSPLGLAAFDAQISGTAVEPAARLLLRRLLGPARYSPEKIGHFGLAAPLYLHFTSPIRRYADLVVHRLLKRFLNGDRHTDAMAKGLEAIAAHIDDAARRSARAEEERLRTLVATSLLDRIGAVFPGRVVGHKPFGALIQLPGIVATMPEGTVALGAALDVRIMAVDAELGRVEVAPAATST